MPGKVKKVTLQASYLSLHGAKTLNTTWEGQDDRRKQEIRANTLVIVGAEARDQLG